MIGFEKICIAEKPDCVVVVGDVNSTVAAGLVAKKLNISLVHVEAGLRSFDRRMPEEINRLATDSISDIFFTTEKDGSTNLLNEGHDPSSIFFVGNVMIDNLFFQLSILQNNPDSITDSLISFKKSITSPYICLTLHRPSNVDDDKTLFSILECIHLFSLHTPVIFPCHPRTKKNIEKFGFLHFFTPIPLFDSVSSGFFLFPSLDYNDFLFLWKDCRCVITDSGGLQEETTALSIPCITVRENTERPITVEYGSNILVGNDPGILRDSINKALGGSWKKCMIPELWDGCASERIVSCIKTLFSSSTKETF